jgi:hypothetical protein
VLISRLIGGLGNQMFQYAAVRALASAQLNTFKLDVSSLIRETHHQGFQLQDIFKGTFETATSVDLRATLGRWKSLPNMRYLLAKPIGHAFRGSNYVVEPHFQFWPGLKQVCANAYLAGYWQSERYFFDYAQTIRDDFAFKPPITNQNNALVEQIKNSNAVSLHVRRGDYVNSPSTAAHHGVCSTAYYQRAIYHILEKVGPAVVFIFSDDPQWVRVNLQVNGPCVYVDHNRGPASYVDMQLMSLCNHHIIANSSFSWWGAWLNPNAEKIVVAPKNWFARPMPTQDLLPLEWIRL